MPWLKGSPHGPILSSPWFKPTSAIRCFASETMLETSVFPSAILRYARALVVTNSPASKGY